MSSDENDIQIKFKKAIEDIKSSNLNLDNDKLLELYGYYKQATDGDCNIKEPSFFDFKSKAKYDVWNKNKGMSKEKAMKRYVKVVSKLLK